MEVRRWKVEEKRRNEKTKRGEKGRRIREYVEEMRRQERGGQENK